jgi:hypothetical protein
MAFRAKPHNREFFFTMNASYGAIPGIQPFLLTIRAGDEISAYFGMIWPAISA